MIYCVRFRIFKFAENISFGRMFCVYVMDSQIEVLSAVHAITASKYPHLMIFCVIVLTKDKKKCSRMSLKVPRFFWMCFIFIFGSSWESVSERARVSQQCARCQLMFSSSLIGDGFPLGTARFPPTVVERKLACAGLAHAATIPRTGSRAFVPR